jgi:alkylation response protein AidB-like acyl-CoA dehydrogenase
VPGSWDVTGLRGTGSNDWTVEDVFLPERRTMPQLGIPLENQWARWPGVTYQLPVQCWVGPHHSAVITGVARAGIDALIELAGGKTPRGRTGALLCENPQVQDAVGRADATLNAGRAYRSAMIAELWNTVASGQKTTLEQRARCRLAVVYAPTAREAMDLTCRHGGSTLQAREPPRRMLARPAHRRPDRHARAGVVPDRRPRLSRPRPRPAAPLAEAYNDCYRNPIDNHGIAAMINSEMTSAPM